MRPQQLEIVSLFDIAMVLGSPSAVVSFVSLIAPPRMRFEACDSSEAGSSFLTKPCMRSQEAVVNVREERRLLDKDMLVRTCSI